MKTVDTSFEELRGSFMIREGTNDSSIIQEVWGLSCYFDKQSIRVSPGDVVVDVGAHIGAFTILASKMGGKVYAFEPERDNFKMLQMNVDRNLSDATLFNLALCNKTGTCNLYLAEYNMGAHSTAHRVTNNIQIVTCGRLFDYVNGGIDFLKMDCEGGEYEILHNLDLSRVGKLSMEYHGPAMLKLMSYLMEKNIRIVAYGGTLTQGIIRGVNDAYTH